MAHISKGESFYNAKSAYTDFYKKTNICKICISALVYLKERRLAISPSISSLRRSIK